MKGPGSYWGSSPLTRGRPSSRTHPGGARWIIPAYAGSTRRSIRSLRRLVDHPRLRGVDEEIDFSPVEGQGSSPLTRGRRIDRLAGCETVRIIPAYAGSTEVFLPVPRGSTDHPRLRGVDARGPPAVRDLRGSSPLTRGRLKNLTAELGEERIIPAYAGSTAFDDAGHSDSPDHPRLRGVDGPGEVCEGEGRGSSPLTRGRPSWQDYERPG